MLRILKVVGSISILCTYFMDLGPYALGIVLAVISFGG